MEYKIRKIEESEIERLVILCKNHAEYEKCDFEEKDKAENLRKAIFSKKPQLFCFVVEIQNQIEGYFTYTFDFSTWDAQVFMYLDCVYLEPDFRGMKIGEKIFEQLKIIALEKKCVNIQWQTPVFNERAIHFYHKIGASSKDKIRFFQKIQ
jgi:GNAT superfamily N-acetyltransferase